MSSIFSLIEVHADQRRYPIITTKVLQPAMINESIFLTQAVIIASFALIALRLGKDALVSFISLMGILANLFVLKQTTLFGFAATCSDAFSIGAVLGLNLLQEYYGKAEAQKAIFISFLFLIFYTLMSAIHLLYAPHISDISHIHFYTLLHVMPRIATASLGVYVLVQYLDSQLYAQLRIRMPGKYLVMRSLISLAATQLLDTILFSFFGLYGVVDNLFQIIIVSYIIKLSAILVATPFVAASQWLST